MFNNNRNVTNFKYGKNELFCWSFPILTILSLWFVHPVSYEFTMNTFITSIWTYLHIHKYTQWIDINKNTSTYVQQILVKIIYKLILTVLCDCSVQYCPVQLSCSKDSLFLNSSINSNHTTRFSIISSTESVQRFSSFVSVR